MLSKKTKYGIKALTHLARQENQAPVQIATISEAENISQNFEKKVFLKRTRRAASIREGIFQKGSIES